ncbi:glycosyl hydrolase 115 family protein [Galbibacter sp.]|uniref:glycosyl hydrolase 115 family protein n=1 Tax=Galbibacter sp. TaxID=2918471 RepID=UPI002C3B7F9E|nr:glycosyl hydrolase 115 family protein [Galbibacter sp.]HLV62847.1 glycosyl hydrolase 115 family protein [Galbibacter sp.]
MKTRNTFIHLVYFTLLLKGLYSFAQESYITYQPIEGGFAIVDKNTAAPILFSNADYPGVQKVAKELQGDIEKVTGIAPEISSDFSALNTPTIIVGTLGKNKLIDRLIQQGKINKDALEGKWEKFITTIVKDPTPEIEKALIIVGSDKRGTLYGLYDLSSKIGISPWHFWSDVPAKKHQTLYVTPGIHTMGEPEVQYRGIFINDEAPALSGWVSEHYGKFNAAFYEKVFQLILRLKGNFLWPAMWGRMFYVDDPKNKAMADLYGIVIGTSHHEPLGRAHAEWQKFGNGPWDYTKNKETLDKFWREGMQRMDSTEVIVTVGMRGDGDEPMTEGTAIDLLEKIVKRQREIITEVTGQPSEETPQMWALYKEVQDYYDQGMRVPEDITLLLCDDNWGNIRKLPYLDAAPRQGGYGIYYHFDYVGDPRNYKWMNTNQIERTWEQMNLAYSYGATKLWVVNVGDIKPMELPISFFLDYAWNPKKWTPTKVAQYYEDWAENIFGEQHSEAIADILKKYTKYNARRKHELLSPATYSLKHYNEADRILKEFDELVKKTLDLADQIPASYQDAYYQLVQFPVVASANLNDLYIAAAKNRRYAAQGRAIANHYAEKVKEYFKKDSLLTLYYHRELADGKWNHMMSQTHIGYTSWQEPRYNNIPEVTYVELQDNPTVGVSVSGSTLWFPKTKDTLVVPELSSFNPSHPSITLFNAGKKSYKYKIKSKDPWVILSKAKGKVVQDENIELTVDWNKAPLGQYSSTITIEAEGEQIAVKLPINHNDLKDAIGFIEQDGVVSIQAENYSHKRANAPFKWQVIPNIGKTSSGVTITPEKIAPQEITDSSPRLGYDFHSFSTGEIKVHTYFSPTQNYTDRDGLKFGIGIDDTTPQLVNFHRDTAHRDWQIAVADNIKIITTTHTIDQPGNHQLYYYLVDSGLVLQKIVIDTGGLKESYLGPAQSFKKTDK